MPRFAPNSRTGRPEPVAVSRRFRRESRPRRVGIGARRARNEPNPEPGRPARGAAGRPGKSTSTRDKDEACGELGSCGDSPRNRPSAGPDPLCASTPGVSLERPTRTPADRPLGHHSMDRRPFRAPPAGVDPRVDGESRRRGWVRLAVRRQDPRRLEGRGGSAKYRGRGWAEIVGVVDPASKSNTFLRTEKTYGDFVFKVDLKFDIPGTPGSSSRSHERPEKNGVRVFGYQAESTRLEGLVGRLYDEARRGWLYDPRGPTRGPEGVPGRRLELVYDRGPGPAPEDHPQRASPAPIPWTP